MARVIGIRERVLQSRDAIELLSNKWRITVIHILRDGALRTNEIQGAMSEVSPKVLTQTLRGMERDGLIHREIFNVVPPRVEYRLTLMGESLIKPLEDLCHWAKKHVWERDEARNKFDLGSKAQRVRRAPPIEPGTGPRRTPFCASSLDAQKPSVPRRASK